MDRVHKFVPLSTTLIHIHFFDTFWGHVFDIFKCNGRGLNTTHVMIEKVQAHVDSTQITDGSNVQVQLSQWVQVTLDRRSRLD